MTIHQDFCMRKLTQHHSKGIHLCFKLSFFYIFSQTQNVFLSVADFSLPQLPSSLHLKNCVILGGGVGGGDSDWGKCQHREGKRRINRDEWSREQTCSYPDDHGHHLGREGRGQRADVRPQNWVKTHRFNFFIIRLYIRNLKVVITRIFRSVRTSCTTFGWFVCPSVPK